MRACEEVQGTFALTILGRGFGSKVSPGGVDFFASECVSCGACVQACPTATLNEKSVIEMGTPERTVVTTCAYCGVGCSFKAEMKGDAGRPHGALQGRQGQRGPFLRQGPLRLRLRHAQGPHRQADDPRTRSTDPWREVSWDEAIQYAASEFKRMQAQYGRDSIGAITSSRCTNEEVFLVQKLVRAGFGNNNVDTCARVCHSPTGYGLEPTPSALRPARRISSRSTNADVILVIGANPTDAHPVFASRMKKRLRAGARLIVVDPAPHRSRRARRMSKADYHLPLLPGTNVASSTRWPMSS